MPKVVTLKPKPSAAKIAADAKVIGVVLHAIDATMLRQNLFDETMITPTFWSGLAARIVSDLLDRGLLKEPTHETDETNT